MKTLPFLFGLLFWGSLAAQTQSELFLRPGVIGDSLSQGFFGVTVEKKTQEWAYPVLVVKQAEVELRITNSKDLL